MGNTNRVRVITVRPGERVLIVGKKNHHHRRRNNVV